ncbi:hypothetical protein [Paenirhodobacter sp.]
MPAWTPTERQFAQEEGAELLVIATQNMVLRGGIMSTLAALRAENVIA